MFSQRPQQQTARATPCGATASPPPPGTTATPPPPINPHRAPVTVAPALGGDREEVPIPLQRQAVSPRRPPRPARGRRRPATDCGPGLQQRGECAAISPPTLRQHRRECHRCSLGASAQLLRFPCRPPAASPSPPLKRPHRGHPPPPLPIRTGGHRRPQKPPRTPPPHPPQPLRKLRGGSRHTAGSTALSEISLAVHSGPVDPRGPQGVVRKRNIMMLV